MSSSTGTSTKVPSRGRVVSTPPLIEDLPQRKRVMLRFYKKWWPVTNPFTGLREGDEEIDEGRNKKKQRTGSGLGSRSRKRWFPEEGGIVMTIEETKSIFDEHSMVIRQLQMILHPTAKTASWSVLTKRLSKISDLSDSEGGEGEEEIEELADLYHKISIDLGENLESSAVELLGRTISTKGDQEVAMHFLKAIASVPDGVQLRYDFLNLCVYLSVKLPSSLASTFEEDPTLESPEKGFEGLYVEDGKYHKDDTLHELHKQRQMHWNL